eukprot:4499620-Alexandrium_andersonii.AAC.1
MAQLHTIAANMATKNDLRELRTSLLQETRAAISESVDPLKDEMADIRTRVERLETGGPAASTDSKRQLLFLNSLDLAQRRISIIGFADAVSAADRVAALDEIAKK